MRRLVTITIIGVLFLSACRREGDLTSAEVLRRATLESMTLQSADVTLHVDLSVRKTGLLAQGNALLQGRLGHGGQQAAFAVNAQGSLATTGAPAVFTLAADGVLDGKDAYLHIRSLSSEPPHPSLTGSGTLLNQWWKFAGLMGDGNAQSLTPDPRFLRAQAEVVTVTRDDGLVDVSGHDAYQYQVAIDPDRLVALLQKAAQEEGREFDEQKVRADIGRYTATGEMWIDAETFVVHALSWTVLSKDDPRTLTLTLRADLRNHNVAGPVAAPDDAKPLTTDTLLQFLLPFSGAPVAPTVPGRSSP